ncbi:MAG: hypothetical protein [Caudoviricetes sp.]|nr:MAG: hypothetical protein [Caudoviricetes sp.]
MAENNSSSPLKTAEGNDLAIDIAEHTAEADAICRKLYNQYGHEQTAKNAREWIQIAKQLLDEALQVVAAQAAPAANQLASQGQEAMPVVEKLAFVNGAPAACGCHHEFSSGGGEYSDVAYVHLCPAHTGVAPRIVLDDEWRRRLLDGAAIERDEMGCAEHPALPLLEEGMKPKQFFDALGIELQCVMAEDQMDMDAYEAMIEVPNYNAWTPGAPDGEGWKQVAIFDTEDGPACWWIREAPPSPRTRHPRNTPAAVAVPAVDQYLCQAWGETDLPAVAIVGGLDAVRQFLIDHWLGSADHHADDGTNMLEEAMVGMQEEWTLEGKAWKWEAQFEIGGVSVQRVDNFTPALPATEDSSAGDLAEGEHAVGLARACELLSTTIGILMGQREKIGYTDCSAIASTVNEAVKFLRVWPSQLPKAEVQAEPVMFINPKVIDKSTGKIAPGTGALTHADSKHGGWTFPVYAAPQAQAADALNAAELKEVQQAISDFEECGETAVSYELLMRAANAGYLDCTRFAATQGGQQALDAAMVAAQEGGNAAKEA